MVNTLQSHRHSSLELWTCARVDRCMSMSIEQERRRAGIALWVLVHTRTCECTLTFLHL